MPSAAPRRGGTVRAAPPAVRAAARTAAALAVAAAVTSAALLLAGCGSGAATGVASGAAPPSAASPSAASPAAATPESGSPPPRRTGPPTELAAVIRQYREDEAAGTIQISIENTSGAPVTVQQVQLASPSFARVAPTGTGGAVLEPGQLTDFIASVGAPRCGSPFGSGSALATVVEGRRARTVSIPLYEEGQVLERLFTKACRQEELRAALGVRLEPSWTRATRDGRPALEATLRLTPSGGRRVQVTGFTGSVLFTLRSASAEPIEVPLGGAALRLDISRGRCDAHAIGETKKPYDFGILVRVDDGAEENLAFTPDEPTRKRLYAELLGYLCRG